MDRMYINHIYTFYIHYIYTHIYTIYKIHVYTVYIYILYVINCILSQQVMLRCVWYVLMHLGG